MTYTLAPAAVIRAAAWPLDTLDGFGGEGDYEDVIARERARLWERTAGDPAFMKALALASPSLAMRMQTRAGPRETRDKRARHLDTSLYRYLSRAATCTTPHGLWAGVALARFGAEDQTIPATGRVDFTPDLVPFVAKIAEYSETARYRDSARYRLTPTLRMRAGGAWSFFSRSVGGEIELREVEANAGLDRLFERLGNAGTGSLDELAARAHVPRAALEQLQASGILVGGLSFPTRFTTPWEALAAAGEQLLGHDREAWRASVTQCSELCSRLAADFDRLSPFELAETRGLRCDLRLPYDVTLGPQTRTTLLDLLAANDRPLTASTRERRVALLARLRQGPIAMGDEIPPLPPMDDELVNPWGCLVARLDGGIVGIDDSPVRPFARHGALLGPEASAWPAELVSKLESEHGVVACELAVPFEGNPNVLARPNLTRQSFEPWGADGPDLRGAELRADSGALVVHIPSVGRVMVIAACSAVAVPCDPMAGPFAVMGFSETFGEVEDAAPPSTALDVLAKLPRRERYERWRAIAKERAWPKLVSVAIGGGRPLVVPTSSPLAVEAAFEGAKGAVVVEPAELSARVAGHVADVAVPFARTPHAYSSLTPSGARRAS